VTVASGATVYSQNALNDDMDEYRTLTDGDVPHYHKLLLQDGRNLS